MEEGVGRLAEEGSDGARKVQDGEFSPGREVSVGWGPSDLPVMAVGIENTADAPSVVLIFDRGNLGGSGCNGSGKYDVRIVDGEDEAGGGAGEGLRAEVSVLRGFVGYPELRRANREVANDRAIVF